MTRYAVLLRGINLGRARRVAMADLRQLLTTEGYGDVTTLLQSGNVALDADLAAGPLARAIERALNERFGFPIDVIVRTREEFRKVVDGDPLGHAADDGSRYFVGFMAPPGLTTRPGQEDAVTESLRGVDPGDDQWVVDGGEFYVWCPQGMLDSPVMAALGKAKGGPVTTVRNWNTVRRLAARLG